MSDEKNKTKFNFQGIKDAINKERKYFWLMLLLFYIIIYGYTLLQINSFNEVKPTPAQISNNLKTTTLPAINQSVVNKLEQLKNNSVNVQALFNKARSNPFQ